MAKFVDELSVFFPAYNEEKNIKNTVLNAKKILEEIAEKWEILIINDGSTDKTGEISNELSLQDRRIRLITHVPNKGYGASLKSGFYNSKYNWIAFTDADGQFDFSEIVNFVQKQHETDADLVVGYYLDRKVAFYRKFNTFVWELIIFSLFGLKVKDIDCGFKLISKKVIDSIPKLESERGAFISSEFLIKANKKNFRIVQLSVHHYPRIKGKGTGANLDVIIKSFIDLLRLWKKLR